MLPVVLYGCETWSLTLREEHRLQQLIKYKELGAEVKKLTREIRRDDWDKFVRSLERDLTGP
jgi:hypothetical protein